MTTKHKRTRKTEHVQKEPAPETIPEDDKNYIDDVVASVGPALHPEYGHGWHLMSRSGNSYTLFPPKDPKDWKHTPFRPGDTIRCYRTEHSKEVYGLVHNGKVLFYDPPGSFLDALAAELARDGTNIPKFKKEAASLPEVFKRRIQGFRERRPTTFRVIEPYETFCCVEAMKIVEAARTQKDPVNWIDALPATRPEEILEEVPRLSREHTAHTFAVACTYARCYLLKPEMLPKLHSAFCILAGCAECGCFAATKEAQEEREQQAQEYDWINKQ